MVAAMFSYEVTATGPQGFQVSVTHPVYGTHLIGNFCSLQMAETFADDMRETDLGPSHRTADYRIETLIRRNHELIAAAAKPRSDIRETKVKADHTRAQGRMMRAHWQKRWNAEPEHPLVMFGRGLATRH